MPEAVEWLWSREVDLSASKVGWRQRVVLSSECGQFALIAVDVLAEDGESSGGRCVIIQEDEQPPLHLHNRTQHELYVSAARDDAGRMEPPLKLAPGAHGSYCCPSALDDRLSLSSLHMAEDNEGGSTSGAADALAVSTSWPSREPPVTFALSPPRILNLVVAPRGSNVEGEGTSVDEGGDGSSHHERAGGPVARAAICQQGPTCLVVFLPPHESIGIPPPPPPPQKAALPSHLLHRAHGIPTAPPSVKRDISVGLSFANVSLVVWDDRYYARAGAAAATAPRVGSRGGTTTSASSAGAPPTMHPSPLIHLHLGGGSFRYHRTHQPPPLPSWLEAGASRMASTCTSSITFAARTFQVDSWGAGLQHSRGSASGGRGTHSAKVVLSAEAQSAARSATAPHPTTPQLRLSMLSVQPSSYAPRYIQLLEAHLQPFEASFDDALLSRARRFIAHTYKCMGAASAPSNRQQVGTATAATAAAAAASTAACHLRCAS